MSYAKIRPRRSTKTEWELVNPILMEGELGVEFPDTGIGTGLCKFKIGDGFSSWKDLAYAFDATVSSSINGGTVTESNEIILRSGTTEEWETMEFASGNPEYQIVFREDFTQYNKKDAIAGAMDIEFL